MLSFPAGISSLQLSKHAVRYAKLPLQTCPDKGHMQECCSRSYAKAGPGTSVHHLEAYNCHLGSFSKSKALQGNPTSALAQNAQMCRNVNKVT